MKKILALLLSMAMLLVPMTALAATSIVPADVAIEHVYDKITITGSFETADAAADRIATLIVVQKDKDFSEDALKSDANLIKWADQSIVAEDGKFTFVIETFNFGNGEYKFQISAPGIDKRFTGEFKYSEAEMEKDLVEYINDRDELTKGGMNKFITVDARERITELDADVVAAYEALADKTKVDEAMADKTSYASLKDFVDDLKEEIADNTPSGGGGNGGGSSSGGSSPITGGGAVGGGADAGLIAEPSGNPFLDIPGNYWGKDQIIDLYNKGIVKGQGNGYFRPDNTITRAEFVQMVVMAFGFEMKGDAANFTDVADSDWFANSVRIAFANGVVNGTSATTFSPLNNITRQDMMTILYNAAKAKGINLTKGSTGFTDASYISGYAQDAVAAMVGSKVVSGYTDGSVKPLNNASRAEAAAMLSRLLEVK